MINAIAINGSPRKERGNTHMILEPFMQGMIDAGGEVDLFYASDLKVKSCSCDGMYCWYNKPGECCIKDEMQTLYPKLWNADILVLATPIYIPLPGDMQNLINRLCPLIQPKLEKRNGRTRARLHGDVRLQKYVLVSTGDWWEVENADVVVHIVRELAENSSAEFAGAVRRPHSMLMMKDGEITEDARQIIASAREAGKQLIRDGKMSDEILEAVSRPLIPEDQLRGIYNQMCPA